MDPTDTWLITGVPGAGKTTVARWLGSRMKRAAHIEGDLLWHEWIVSGYVAPDGQPKEEADRQVQLCIRNQCLLARSFSEAGFVPILDFVVPSRHDLDAFRADLGARPLYFVVLAPGVDLAFRRDRDRSGKTVAPRWAHMEAEFRRDLGGTGLWADSGKVTADETVDRVLAHKADALLDSI